MKYLFLFLMLTNLVWADIAPSLNTTENQKILQKVEQALSSLTTLKSRFSHYSTAEKDFIQSGEFYLKKPNQMRLIYDKPSEIEFLADGKYFIYIDKSIDQISGFPIEETPAAILLKENFKFSDPEFMVTDIQKQFEEYHITAIKKDHPEFGQLTLITSENPVSLKQWILIDAKKIKTNVALFEIEEGINLSPDLFVLKP